MLWCRLLLHSLMVFFFWRRVSVYALLWVGHCCITDFCDLYLFGRLLFMNSFLLVIFIAYIK